MDYDPTKLKESEAPKPGTTLPAKVVSIKQDLLKNLLPQERLAKWPGDTHGQTFLNVGVESSVGGTNVLLPLPPLVDGVVRFHPSSNLGKWKKKFGAVPVVGQEVFVTANGNGFFNVEL